jgi:hypothetical protein
VPVQVRGHQAAEGRQVVPTFLHDDRREPGPPEQPGVLIAVPRDEERSGEIFLAGSTTCRSDRDGNPEAARPPVAGRGLDPLFEAVVDAAEESVLNSMLQSRTTLGRDGNTSGGLDAAELAELLEGARRGGL